MTTTPLPVMLSRLLNAVDHDIFTDAPEYQVHVTAARMVIADAKTLIQAPKVSTAINRADIQSAIDTLRDTFEGDSNDDEHDAAVDLVNLIEAFISQRTKAFTVIAYRDGDRGVDTWIEHVTATDSADAWEVFLEILNDDERENVTEITTLAGHLTAA